MPACLLTILCLQGVRDGAAAGSAAPGPAHASEPGPAMCNLCDKPIPAGQAVVLRPHEGEPQPYRCVHCALTAQAAGLTPSTVDVRSPVSGSKITIRRDEEGWRVEPSRAVFLSLPEAGDECIDRHRAFIDQEEYLRYLDDHPGLAREDAVPYSIEQLAALLAAGLPSGGIRPEAGVQLLVVGMLTHLPFKQHVLPAIQGALDDVGEGVGARLVDATRPEGRAILSARGVHDHLPVVMFLDDETRFTAGGKTIDLRGFPGETWTREDLTTLLRLAVERSVGGADSGTRLPSAR